MTTTTHRLARVDSFHDRVLDVLQKMREDDLTRSVIIPLFRVLGFGRIEYTGGPGEKGRDITCWREDLVG